MICNLKFFKSALRARQLDLNLNRIKFVDKNYDVTTTFKKILNLQNVYTSIVVPLWLHYSTYLCWKILEPLYFDSQKNGCWSIFSILCKLQGAKIARVKLLNSFIHSDSSHYVLCKIDALLMNSQNFCSTFPPFCNLCHFYFSL